MLGCLTECFRCWWNNDGFDIKDTTLGRHDTVKCVSTCESKGAFGDPGQSSDDPNSTEDEPVPSTTSFKNPLDSTPYPDHPTTLTNADELPSGSTLSGTRGIERTAHSDHDQTKRYELEERAIKTEPPTIDSRKKKSKVAVKRDQIHQNEELDKMERRSTMETGQAKEKGIIINFTFKSRGKKRKNYEKDIARIKEVFGKLGNIQMELLEDLALSELKRRIGEVIASVDRDQKSIFVILTTHGLGGDILLGEERVSVKTFLGYFDELFEKELLQKVFLLSFCRDGVPIMSKDEFVRGHCQYKNTFIGYATLPGYECYSGPGGGIYLEAILHIISEMLLKNDGPIDMFKVQRKSSVMIKECLKGESDKDQYPCKYSSLERCIIYPSSQIGEDISISGLVDNLVIDNSE